MHILFNAAVQQTVWEKMESEPVSKACLLVQIYCIMICDEYTM